MQINLTGHHIEVTPALRSYVETKFERVGRHFDNVTGIHVVLSVQKQLQKAEASIYIAGSNLFADAEHDDMYAAIDALVDKLDRQILKHKDKLTDHHRADGGLKSQKTL
jgi:putative sigma-54 modulation protein